MHTDLQCLADFKPTKKGPKLTKAQKAKQEEEERKQREEGHPPLFFFNLFLRMRANILHMHLTSHLLLCAEEARLRAEKEELERLEQEKKQAEIERLELKVTDT